mmetsp:Transcript_21758/g.71969  ORF Transcript_21758/g.71969 Transcript_21758/m.71969 type:complete len:243 (-) Transcript_21758:755-1483(-)
MAMLPKATAPLRRVWMSEELRRVLRWPSACGIERMAPLPSCETEESAIAKLDSRTVDTCRETRRETSCGIDCGMQERHLALTGLSAWMRIEVEGDPPLPLSCPSWIECRWETRCGIARMARRPVSRNSLSKWTGVFCVASMASCRRLVVVLYPSLRFSSSNFSLAISVSFMATSALRASSGFSTLREASSAFCWISTWQRSSAMSLATSAFLNFCVKFSSSCRRKEASDWTLLLLLSLSSLK